MDCGKPFGFGSIISMLVGKKLNGSFCQMWFFLGVLGKELQKKYVFLLLEYKRVLFHAW
jgi:hypothetical protein